MSFDTNGAPDIVSLTPGFREVTMVWREYPGATGYRLSWAQIQSGQRGPVKSTTVGPENTRFRFSGLSGGQNYQFFIQAINGRDFSKVTGQHAWPQNEIKFSTATIPDQRLLQNMLMAASTLPEIANVGIDAMDEVVYEITPDLPKGLAFDARTRTLSGIPTEKRDSTTYSYLATVDGGVTAKLTFELTVTSGSGIEEKGMRDWFLHHSLPDPVSGPPQEPLNPAYVPPVTLSVAGLDDSDSLRVYRITGEDAISRPFQYEIHLVYAGIPEGGKDPRMEFRQLLAENVLDRNATLSMAVFDGSNQDGRAQRRFHGFIDEFSELVVHGELQTEFHYRLVLKPRFARLARNRQSRIHATSGQPQTLASLISGKLTATGTDYKVREEGAGLIDIAASQGHAVLASSEFDTTEIQHDRSVGLSEIMNLSHVTQHDETDLDFISRICEQRGVYYYFEHDTTPAPDGSETVRFCNAANIYEGDDSGQSIWLRESDPGNPQSTAHIQTGTERLLITGNLYSFRRVVRPRPKKIRMRSYNPNNPNLWLEVDQLVPSGKHGVLVDHGTPFRTVAAGEEYARIRAQEVYFDTDYYEGTTTSPWASPGAIFRRIASHALAAEELDALSDEELATLPSGHLQAGGADKYLITHSRLEITQLPCIGISDPDGKALQHSFRNEIRCVNVSTPANTTLNSLHYRPPRTTPVPKLPGIYEAHIDAPHLVERETDRNKPAKRAHLNEKGAYRLRHVDDARAHVDRAAGSMPVPKLEPYVGNDGSGMHFPLRKGTASKSDTEDYRGTEVLLGYRDGNPDRPVILGGVPNETHESPTNADNACSNRIRTFSGSLLEFYDGGAGSESEARIILRSQTLQDDIGGSYFRIGHPDKDQEKLFASRLPFGSPYVQVDMPTDTELQEQSGLLSYTPDHMIREAGGDIRDHANNVFSCAKVDNFIEGRRLCLSGNVQNSFATRPDESHDTDVMVKGGGNVQISSAQGEMSISAHRKLTLTSETEDVDLISPARLTVSSGDKVERINGDETKIVHADTDKWHMGRATSGIMGAKTSTFLGANTSVSLANHCSLKVGGFQSISVGAGLTVKPQINLAIYGKKLEVVALSEVKYVTNNVKAVSATEVFAAAVRVTATPVNTQTAGVSTRILGLETSV